MKPKRTAQCPACKEQVTFFLINNTVVKAGRRACGNPKRRCVDCWNHGREPAPEAGMTDAAGASGVRVPELHSVGSVPTGAPAPSPVAGSGA